MTSHSSTPLIKGETSGIARSLSSAILVVAALGAAALPARHLRGDRACPARHEGP